MKIGLIAMLICWQAFAQSSPAEQSVSFVNEGTVNAPITEVWKVWTTSEGYKAVGVALADVDFRIGGLIRSRYRADGVLGDDETIENRIIAYEPKRMIAIRLFRYLDEQMFRYNLRKGDAGEKLNDSGRFDIAVRQIVDKRLTWDHLTGKDAAGARKISVPKIDAGKTELNEALRAHG